MKALVLILLIYLPISLFAQEVVTCDGSQGSTSCQSSAGVSTSVPVSNAVGLSVPIRTTQNAQKITIPKEGGISLTLKTTPSSAPSNYWVTINNDLAVDFNADLSSKTPTPESIESPKDASSLVLTAGLVNSVDLNLSGYQGKSSPDFSHLCAKDVSQGLFGEDALNNFIQRRLTDPNIPTDQCDNTDLVWMEKNSHDVFCPAGTVDIRDDENPSPTFQLTRLSPKNKCKRQEDVRSCLIRGNIFNCRINIHYDVLGVYHKGTSFGSNYIFNPQFLLASHPITNTTSANFPGTTRIVSQTNVQTAGPDYFCPSFDLFGCVGGEVYHTWRENWAHDLIVEYTDSTFVVPSDRSNADAIQAQCKGFIDKDDLKIYTAEGELQVPRPLPFSLTTPIPLDYGTETKNLECTSFAQNNFSYRNILEITSEPRLDPTRSYDYVNGDCPTGSTVETYDQLHFNSNWTDTYSCNKDVCPNTSLFFSRQPKSNTTANLARGQQGADRGRAVLFTYDVKNVNVAAKYCVDIKDYTNSSDIHFAQTQTPSVTMNQIDYKMYDIKLPDPIPDRIYDSTSKPYIFKRIDSSVRDWIIRLTDN
jgi:hypothetical protein